MTHGSVRRMAALLAALAAVCLAGAAPAPASTLAQKPGTAGCIGEGPACAVGIEIGDAHGVALSPDGRTAYVASRFPGALDVFDRAADGTLRQKAGTAGCISSRAAELLPGFCAPGSGLQVASSVAVSADGRSVYVASIVSSAVAVFDRAADGTLTQKAGSAGCISDSGAAPCADGVGLDGAEAVTVSPDGASVYVAAADSSSVAVFDRAADGALSQKAGLDGCVSETGSGPCLDGRALTGAVALAASADGANVYAVSASGVAVFDRGSDGRLAQNAGPAGCVAQTTAGGCAFGKALDGPTSVALSPDGASLYVAASGSSAAAVFDRGAGGALTQKAGAAGCTSGRNSGGACVAGIGLVQPSAVTVAPDGANVYVTSRSEENLGGLLFEGPGYVAIFDRSAGGTLTQPAGAAGCVSDAAASDPCGDATKLQGAGSVAVSPDGRNAYVTATGTGGLAIFDRVAVAPPPPPPPPDVTRPLLRGLAFAPARLRAAARGAS
ncbi:MAG: 6-phosphogluconolactonase, partial [bacterium]